MILPVLGWRPHGLRAGVTLAFALGALAVSSTLAFGTYFTVRHVLVEQRERTALRQAYADAALVRDRLLTSGTQVSDVLGSLSPPAGAVVYVHRSGRWYSTSLDRPGEELTASVRPTVESGSVALAWTKLTDPHAVVVGIPLPAVNAEYYEVSVAEELASTLRTLALALTICAAFTTLAGALVGRAASRRVLAPLGDVTSAAVKVSAGDMEARLGDTDDPDLVASGGRVQPHGRRPSRTDPDGCAVRGGRQPRAPNSRHHADDQSQPSAARAGTDSPGRARSPADDGRAGEVPTRT